MARNYYSEIHPHLTWHTKGSARLLVPTIEAEVHHHLHGRCVNTPSVFVHNVGGIKGHVHRAVSIAPTILVSEFIGTLAGPSRTGCSGSRRRGGG